MGATIYDIAEKAGVSIATVSRVLNGNERVLPETRKSVMDAAEMLGYQPHLSARNLARRKSEVVSAVIPMMTNLFFAEVLRGLQDRLVESEYQLIVHGCRKIAVVMANPMSRPSVDRRDGYLFAMKKAGLSSSSEDVVTSSDPLHHGYSERAGRQAMESLLSRGSVPDGVFATSDVQALGVIRAIQDAGLRVPDDIRVIGFDDIVVSRYVGLSTLQQPRYEIGSSAIDKLMARIDRADRPVSHTLFSPHLIERQTTSRNGESAVLHLGEEHGAI